MAKAKLTPADNKFIQKFLNSKNELDFDAEKRHFRTNEFSGEEVEVCPICATAIDFVLRLQPLLHRNDARGMQELNINLKPSNAVMNFDRARYLVMKLDSSAYMRLLD